MRPTLLKFGGIGAYPRHVEVDFEQLSKKELYLVVGPTGSGKTTIFDAMTFALYGKTASDRESMFVSDHDNRVDPYVELHFTHQDRRFIAHREPPPDKTRKSIPAKQWFREVDDDGNVVRTETGSTTVTSETADLLGLDAEQFMQVILLPQNKFQKFLMAKSSERKPLLQKIFGTGLYARVADVLKNTAEDLKQQAAEIEQRITVAQGSAHSTLLQLSGQPYFSTLNVSEPSEIQIPEVISGLTSELEKITAKTKKLNTIHTKALEAKNRAQEDAERFDAAVEKSRLDKLQAENAKGVEQAQKNLEAHERAHRVIEVATRAEEVAEASRVSHQEATQLRADLATSLAELAIDSEIKKSLLSAIPTATPITLSSEVSGLHTKVGDALKAITELEGLTEQITALKKDVKACEKVVAGNKKKLATSSKTLVTKKADLKDSVGATKKLPGLDKKIADLDALIKAADVEGTVIALGEAEAGLEKAQKAFNDAETKLSQARRNMTLHLAGELAATLVKDEECPVCGSTSHPKKAKRTAESEISTLEEKRDKTYNKKQRAESIVTEAQDDVTKAKAAEKKLPPEEEQEALRELYDFTVTKAKLSEYLAEEVEEIEDEIDELREASKIHELRLGEINSELKQKRSRVVQIEPVAQSLGTKKAVTDADIILRHAVNVLDQIEDSETKAMKNKAKAEEAHKQLKSILKIEKFSSVSSAHNSHLDAESIVTLSSTISEFDKRADRILILCGKIGDTAPPKTRPDVDDLTEKAEHAETERKASSDHMTTTENAITALTTEQEKIDKLGPKAQETAQRAESAQALFKVVANGAGSGENLQLGLEEWVQRTLFEEVCLVATTQLQKLSNNRYFLTLEPEGAKMRKRAGGLELYVLDSHNGKTRSVHTLSGGEQFLTSLALALALAEVVQRHAGGMQLSTLFIDEGFGSLDSETLEQATSVLTKLQDIGRTVGLITHVESMVERLPIGIRITKTNSGSTLELVD
jgi:exonuclease SbcC